MKSLKFYDKQNPLSGKKENISMVINIEKAKADDLEALYGIERECFTLEAFSKKQIGSLLRNPNSISLLAKLNGEIVGFIVALIYEEKKEKIGHIFTLDVAVKARRKGVGLKLLESAEQILREKEVKICFLEVRGDNVAARELYRKLGYVEVGLLKDFYFSGGHGVRLRKNLNNL